MTKTYDIHPEDEISGSVYEKIAAFIGPGRRVVDFGCATGTLARTLVSRGCSVCGVDINPESIAVAAPFCERTSVADLDVVTPAEAVAGERFDVAVYADVLEHLKDPWRVLRSTKEVLTEDGFVVVSIPNISHAAVVFALLNGRFEYQPLGVLDDTHLRFFTRRSVFALLRGAGFTPTGFDRTIEPLSATSELLPHFSTSRLAEETIRQIVAYPDAETLQFVVRADLQPRDRQPVDGDQDATDNVESFPLAGEREITALQAAILDAAEYGKKLENEIVALKDELARASDHGEKLRREIAQLKAWAAASDSAAELTRQELKRLLKQFKDLQTGLFGGP